MYTDERIEQAARILCATRNKLPDDMISYYGGALLNPPRPRWCLAAEEIRSTLAVQDALNKT